MPFSSHSLVFACFNVASSAIIFRYYNAWRFGSGRCGARWGAAVPASRCLAGDPWQSRGWAVRPGCRRDARIAPAVAGARESLQDQPGYDGLPGGAQGLRALASITIRIMITIRTLLGSTKVATKFEGNFQLPKKTTMSRSRRQSRDCCDCCRLRDYDHGVALEAKSMYNLLVLFSEQHAS